MYSSFSSNPRRISTLFSFPSSSSSLSFLVLVLLFSYSEAHKKYSCVHDEYLHQVKNNTVITGKQTYTVTDGRKYVYLFLPIIPEKVATIDYIYRYIYIEYEYTTRKNSLTVLYFFFLDFFTSLSCVSMYRISLLPILNVDTYLYISLSMDNFF